MTETQLQENFPAGAEIPELLRALLRFQNEAPDWYSGHFEFRKWPYGNAAWCGGNQLLAHRFVIFGQDSDDSLYGFWLVDGQWSPEAPVIFLGSEGTDSNLLAKDLRQFVALLAVGAGDLGFAASWGKIIEEVPAATRLAEFRSWLKESFQIAPLPKPVQTVVQAREMFPDFGNWLDEMLRP